MFYNIGDNETIRTIIKDGFKIHNGHPTFDKTWTDPINAKQFAAELVKHTIVTAGDCLICRDKLEIKDKKIKSLIIMKKYFIH